MDVAKYKLEAAFEFFTKIGIEYYCFHVPGTLCVMGAGNVILMKNKYD